jgi:hypothetical protein
MTHLQINSPEMQDVFETRFHSNQEKFMEFIVTFIQDNKRAIDNYFQRKPQSGISYKKLNPQENYYTLSVDENETEMTNPFEHVEDAVALAKKLREASYR